MAGRPVQPITHGTRQGYRKGCKTDADCPANPSCRQANNQYTNDLKIAHKRAHPKPPLSVNRPVTGGLRVTVGNRTSGQVGQESMPIPDVAYVDPPASLLDAQVAPDPSPADMPDGQYVYSEEPAFVVTPGIRADAKGKLALFGVLIATPLDMVDPYCGGVLSENLDNMIDKAMPLISRSPAAIKFLTGTSGGIMEWLAFLQACWPVIVAIYAHHLGRSVVRDINTGQFVRVDKQGNKVDATMPPVPETYEYSAA
jgi:hypothetical protein